MERSKTASYLGFARRAGKLTLGIEAASAERKKVFLLVADETASANSRKEIAKLQKKFACPLLFVRNLEDMTGKACCKLAAVRDEGLAAAIVRENKIEEL